MSKKFLSGINVTGTATLNTVANAGLDTDKFLVLDAAGNIDYRTGAELKSDIGADRVSRVEHEVKLGESMSIGTPVYVPIGYNSSTNMVVMKASNASEATSSKTMGLVASSGITNDFVQVVTEGLLSGLNTSTASQGDPVWLGVNGALIFGLANKPVAPAHLVFLGIVTRVNSNNGEIFVKVQNGFEMGELHNYAEGSVSDNQVIAYESATSLYKPKSIAAILGYTPADAANIPTRTETVFTATANQTTFNVNYTVGSVEVFYNGSKMAPSEFTATNGTSIVLGSGIPAGTILTVVANGVGGGASKAAFSATAPLAYDSNTGVFSIQAASGSQDGYLSSANWTTFNNKVSSQWVTSGNNIYYSTGAVSVGTSAVGRKFSIYTTVPDDHLLIAGPAPSVSLAEAMSNATYQAKFGLATSNGQFATGATAGDFVISCQAGSTIWAYDSVEKMRLNTAGKLLIGTTTTASSSLLVVNGGLTATTLVKSGGTSSQFLKADGSVDSNTYLTGITSSQVTTALGYTPYNSTNPSGYIAVNNQSYFGINNTSSTSGNGISLYGSYSGGEMNYGIMFAGTGTYGAHGSVANNDWATYFTTNAGGTSRGWIFRRAGSANVASISGSGAASFNGDVYSGGNLYINNTSPTIYLQDTDHRSSMIHCNSNIFYVLRGSGTNSTGWSTYNGYWPLTINLENNDATFGGNITAIYDVTAYSDARVKKNVTTIESALDKVMALRGVRYQRIDMEGDKFHIGVIAQETQTVIPEVVEENQDGHLSVAYGNMGGLFIEAIKELKKENNELRDILKRNNLI